MEYLDLSGNWIGNIGKSLKFLQNLPKQLRIFILRDNRLVNKDIR